MATRPLVTCDIKVDGHECGKPAHNQFEMINGQRIYDVDLCADHHAELESKMFDWGFKVRTKTSSSKIRAAYIAKSGTTFSADEARDWLAANGYAVPAAGRLSKQMRDIYAEAH